MTLAANTSITKSKNLFYFFSFLFLLFFLTIPSVAKASLQSDITGADSKDAVWTVIQNAGTQPNMDGQNIWDGSKVIPPAAGNPPKFWVKTGQGNIPFTFTSYEKSPLLNAATRYFFVCDWNPKLFIIYRTDNVFGNITGTATDMHWRDDGEGFSPADKWIAGEANCNGSVFAGFLEACSTHFEDWVKTYATDATLDSTMSTLGVSASSWVSDIVQDVLLDNLKKLMQTIGMMVNEWNNFLIGLLEKILIVDVNNASVTQAWGAIRNAANVLLVVALLFIAFFNAIRFQIDYYTAKALIPRLAIAAIMINFSFLISKGIIDFGNIFTNYFLTLTQYNNILDSSIVSGFLSGATTLAVAAAVIIAEIAGIGFGLVLALIALIALGILLAILFFRIALLYILTAFSPVVFLFAVLPFTRDLTKQWWNYMARYAFMGAVISVILFIASTI